MNMLVSSSCKGAGHLYGLPREEHDILVIPSVETKSLMDLLDEFFLIETSSKELNEGTAGGGGGECGLNLGEERIAILTSDEALVPELNTANTVESNSNASGSSHLSLPHVVCEHCGKFCKDQVALMHHYYRVHRNNIENLPKLFVCKLCPQQFCQLNKLERHMQSHSKLKIHKCLQCDKSFKRRDHLNDHVKQLHNGLRSKTFICFLCSKSYHFNKDLQRHIKKNHFKMS